MIVVLRSDVSLRDKASIVRFIEQNGGRLLVSELGETTHIGLVDETAQRLADQIEDMAGVETIRSEAPPYPQVSREYRESDTVVDVRDVAVGGAEVVVMAGPCSVESESQISLVAESVAGSGARILRGGAFKPRTSPYSFQGLGEEGLYLLAAARDRTGLPVVTEVVAPDDVELVGAHADMLQIGARNMQN
ncbi:MAG TPA: 3-deoxy-7-phosphoheptulonate synthase, partial [Acidimicrobiia bacterium]